MEQKAEQLRAGIIKSYFHDSLDAPRNSIDLILQAFKEVAEAQRKADRDYLDRLGCIHTIPNNTPLATDSATRRAAK